MTAPIPGPDPEHMERLRADRIAALCVLLTDPRAPQRTDEGVARAVERARALLAASAGTGAGAMRGPGPGSDTAPVPGPDQLDDAFEALDDALRRTGDPRGLLGYVRGILGDPPPGSRLPGLRATIKVAVCPGTEPCTRREPARDLRPAPPCALHGAQMRKVRLRPDPTA
ncbi:hypothetical protein OIE71_18485 [Streptomyces sp. NBC_01725]|uniref:hypothetical protein n=1 Tax=Streptomyces sp. NBC_01725 TaxID=2975923 RepID=UPI002E2D4D69|nr:hypothetical protein [Streptomyces sp. NBC_01725]